jgi:hypothetical protein
MEATIRTDQQGSLTADPPRNNVSTKKFGFVYSLCEIWTSTGRFEISHGLFPSKEGKSGRY